MAGGLDRDFLELLETPVTVHPATVLDQFGNESYLPAVVMPVYIEPVTVSAGDDVAEGMTQSPTVYETSMISNVTTEFQLHLFDKVTVPSGHVMFVKATTIFYDDETSLPLYQKSDLSTSERG